MNETLPGGQAPGRFVKSKYLLLWLFAALFLAMLLFSALTPLVADDYSYKFSWVDNSRITGLGQIFPSMAVHRQITNGRVLTHGLVQLMLMLPKAVFNVLNALNAVLLGWLLLRHVKGGGAARSALLFCCGVFTVWNCTPVFGQVFLWLDGSVNYSWGISLFLLYLWPYAAAWLGHESRSSVPGKVLFLLLAFAAGMYSENGSIASIFAAVCLTGLTGLREKKLRLLPLLGIAAACLGFVFLMSAPAMSGRSAEFSASVLADNFRHIVLTTREEIGILYYIYAGCLCLGLLAGVDRRKLILSLVYVLAGIGSLAAFIFAAYFTYRHLCFSVVFTVLGSLLLLSGLLEKGRKSLPALLTGLMTVAFVFNFLLGALDILVIYGKALERERIIAEALAAGERDIVLEMYVPATKYCAAYKLEDLSPVTNEWPNHSLALYYGFDNLTGIEPQ